ncbi:MAG: hypothetical protein HFF65_03800 [Oscillospiraceae bacterium]|nr:hypothetical protein [Oscillospiraceae bacterium]
MNICLKKTIAQIEQCLPDNGIANVDQLRKMYDVTLRLQSQLLSVIYDMETFGGSAERIANAHSSGKNNNSVVTLTITEPLPSMKRLTEAVEEHWKAMLHVAIKETAKQKPLPYFNKAMVEIEIITPRGSNNAQLWDTSNRAIQVVHNNLKGIFFEDDNMEHMAFSVAGKWGEKGATIIRILDFDRSQQIRGIT